MDLRTGFYVLFLSWLVTVGGIGGRQFHAARESDMQEQLRHLNKPSVKTIKTEYGDIYDCIDFYKQPAFDHPLLKNHNFHPQMRPSSKPTWGTTGDFIQNTKASNFGLDEGCPAGTVPIRRVSDGDRIQAQMLSNTYASRVRPLSAGPKPGTHYAIVQTKTDPGFINYRGVGANMSIYNPPVVRSQYSLGHITIESGPESIQVGWMVNQALYKDDQTRMFIYTDSRDQHCFNTQCPGFIIVSTDVPLDIVLLSSKPGGPTSVYGFQIYQDLVNGNWWLEVSNGSAFKKVGFWPRDIFSGLAEPAPYAACGGVTYSPPGDLDPPMGAGHYPFEDTRFDAYCADIVVVNQEYKFVSVKMDEYTDTDEYRVKDKGIRRSFGHLAYFGGPGTNPSSL